MILTKTITFEGLATTTAADLIERMDIRDTRLANLRHILETKFDGVIARMAEAVQKDANQVRFILFPDRAGGRRIGERLARQLEERLGLAAGDLDCDKSGLAEGANAWPFALSQEQISRLSAAQIAAINGYMLFIAKEGAPLGEGDGLHEVKGKGGASRVESGQLRRAGTLGKGDKTG